MQKAFVIVIGTGFFLVGLIAYISGLANIAESLLFIISGMLYAEMIKLVYRIEALEKKKR